MLIYFQKGGVELIKPAKEEGYKSVQKRRGLHQTF